MASSEIVEKDLEEGLKRRLMQPLDYFKLFSVFGEDSRGDEIGEQQTVGNNVFVKNVGGPLLLLKIWALMLLALDPVRVGFKVWLRESCRYRLSVSGPCES
jgi:hypothetical protein